MIRKALISDVKDIRRLLGFYAGRGLLLLRTMGELYSHIRDYYVYQEAPGGPLLGVAALHVCWEGLGELRSVAVQEDRKHQGIGTRLVEACLSEAVTLGLDRVFVLTYQTRFFGRFGFQVADKNVLPHIVWADCVKCPKFPECDEIAMILDFYPPCPEPH